MDSDSDDSDSESYKRRNENHDSPNQGIYKINPQGLLRWRSSQHQQYSNFYDSEKEQEDEYNKYEQNQKERIEEEKLRDKINQTKREKHEEMIKKRDANYVKNDPVLVSGFARKILNGIYRPVSFGMYRRDGHKDNEKILPFILMENIQKTSYGWNKNSSAPLEPVWCFYTPTRDKYWYNNLIAFCDRRKDDMIIKTLKGQWMLLLSDIRDEWNVSNEPNIKVVAYPTDIIETKEKEEEWRREHPIRASLFGIPQKRKGGRKTKHSTKKNKRKTRKSKKTR
jgi:hypothetical protein